MFATQQDWRGHRMRFQPPHQNRRIAEKLQHRLPDWTEQDPTNYISLQCIAYCEKGSIVSGKQQNFGANCNNGEKVNDLWIFQPRVTPCQTAAIA
jgi:hypothetical protein